MNIQVIAVPYDSGYRGLRMGRGPLHFIQHGIEDMLVASGNTVQIDQIEAQTPFQIEVKTAFELNRMTAARVHAAQAQGDFPLVLSGNCNASLGTVAGLDPTQLGVAWFDAHGDFNTPETTLSGFFDGMGLSVMAGRCWHAIASTIPGFSPIPEENIIHIGGRDFDDEEKRLFEDSSIGLLPPQQIQQRGIEDALAPLLTGLQRRVERVYVHIDLDVLDRAIAPANEFAVFDGLSIEQVEAAIQEIKQKLNLCAVGFASYDPAYDTENIILQAAFRLMQTSVRLG